MCRRCGKLGLHAHHIFSRRHNSIRFLLGNLISLCPDCHNFAHSKPLDFRVWVMQEIGVEVYGQVEDARNLPELSILDMEKLVEVYRGNL